MDLLETVLIINLIVFTLVVFSEDISVKRIFAYVSVTFVILLVLFVIAYRITLYAVGALPKLKRARGKQIAISRPNPSPKVANTLQELVLNFYSRGQ